MATGHPEAAPTKAAKAAYRESSSGQTTDGPLLGRPRKRRSRGFTRSARALRPRRGSGTHSQSQDEAPHHHLRAGERTASRAEEHGIAPGNQPSKSWSISTPASRSGSRSLMEHVTESPARQRMVEVLSERAAGWLAGKDITLWRGGGFFNFVARGSWWAEHQVSEINSKGWGTIKRKWTRAERNRSSRARPNSRGHLHSQGNGHRTSRSETDQDQEAD